MSHLGHHIEMSFMARYNVIFKTLSRLVAISHVLYYDKLEIKHYFTYRKYAIYLLLFVIKYLKQFMRYWYLSRKREVMF